jgi:hypothetical protein
VTSFLIFRRCLSQFRFDDRWSERSGRLGAILGERFAREKDRFFSGIGRRRMARVELRIRTAIIKAALLGAARLETTRLAATIVVASLVAGAIIVRTLFAAARITALRRSVFGGRQITSAWTLVASTAMASASTAPASTAAAVAAAAIILATTIAAAIGAGRVILRGIVVRRKILRRRSIRFRLPLFGVAEMRVVVRFGKVGIRSVVACSVLFHNTWLLGGRKRSNVRQVAIKRFAGAVFAGRFDGGNFLVVGRSGVGQSFAGKQLDDVRWS